MRLSAVPAQAAMPRPDSHRAGPPAPPAPLARLSPSLPGAVADRLADLMAQDPGLAEAVHAQLPAARRESALDLAPYASPAQPARIDVRT